MNQNSSTEIPMKEIGSHVIATAFETVDRENVHECPALEDMDYGAETLIDNMDACFYDSDTGHVVAIGSFSGRERTGTIPASGGGRLEPPTNPPEPIYNEVQINFDVRINLTENFNLGGDAHVKFEQH